jgi:nitroreductase
LVFDTKDQIKDLSDRTIAILSRTAHRLLNPIVHLCYGLARGFQKASFRKVFAKRLLHLERVREAGGDPIFFNAPVVAVAHVPTGSYFGRDDAIYGLYNVALLAERLQLGTCQIGYFKLALDFSASFRESLQLPKGRSPEAAIIIGYPSVDHRRVIPRRKPTILWMR